MGAVLSLLPEAVAEILLEGRVIFSGFDVAEGGGGSYCVNIHFKRRRSG